MEWLAGRLKSQVAEGYSESRRALGILMVTGLGTERNKEGAKRMLLGSDDDPDGPLLYAEALTFAADQPENSREAMSILMPMIEAGQWHVSNIVLKARPHLLLSGDADDDRLSDRALLAAAHSLLLALRAPESLENDATLLLLRAEEITEALDESIPATEEAQDSQHQQDARDIAVELRDQIVEEQLLFSEALLQSPSGKGRRQWVARHYSDVLEVSRNPAALERADALAAQLRTGKSTAVAADIIAMIVHNLRGEHEEAYSTASRLIDSGLLAKNQKEWVNLHRMKAGLEAGRSVEILQELAKKWISDSPKTWRVLKPLLGFLLVGVGTVMLLVPVLITRFRGGKFVPWWLFFLWLPIQFVFTMYLFTPWWIMASASVLSGLLLLYALSGPNAPPYLVAPERPSRTTHRARIQMYAILPVLLLVSWGFNAGYMLLYEKLSGLPFPNFLEPFVRANNAPAGILSLIVFVAVFIPMLEEIIFRGFLHDWLSRVLPFWIAVGLGAGLFGLLHGPELAIPTTIIGLMCIWLRLRFRSLWAPIALHAFNNTSAVLAILLEIHCHP